jgi:hypothetical protein
MTIPEFFTITPCWLRVSTRAAAARPVCEYE